MPANLPPQYFEAERRFREAKTDEEKLGALKQMLAIMPKHKGTDKLQADLRRRISKLKKAAEQRKKQKKGFSIVIEKEGAGQVVLIGYPNVGKSRIIKSLTNATPEVAPYPFTTRQPAAAMMPFDHIQIQLVDSSPITSDYLDFWMIGIIRNSDAVILVADLSSDNPVKQVDGVLKNLLESKINLTREEKETDPRDGIAHKKTMIVGNKAEQDRSGEKFGILKKLYGKAFPIICVSAENDDNMDSLKKEIYKLLGIMRVYTKEPGENPDFDDPVILKIGGTVKEAALEIHKDFAYNLKYARVWGHAKFDGQKVEKDHILQDEDVVEFHI
ncbi:MAG: hypothetical protein AMJ90_02770 [candidate division Zixibacteria bacterium SM23_73_2]|nr:MAG: hypothetical protein AMJ90_02770 [candidate division Zixibacteria bacterium SM23_73_2]